MFSCDPIRTVFRLQPSQCITAWILRFTKNCRFGTQKRLPVLLSTKELHEAEYYWISIIQNDHFQNEIPTLKQERLLKKSSPLLPLHPFLDYDKLLRVGGRQQNSKLSYSNQHPLIIHGKLPVTKLIIHSEHQRLLHAGPTLLTASLCHRYHITRCRKTICSITRGCITCRRTSARPQPQMLGQLPIERINPGPVFNQTGVDYAGPVYIKYGYVCKPTVIKAYVCVFVLLSVKAVHLKLVSDLTSEAFIATLRRFISHRGKPSFIWSDNGMNFVGVSQELQELADFLERQKTQQEISQFCSNQHIKWKFIPEHAPHFGGLCEAAVKSMKIHLRRVVSTHKLTFEEFTTILMQIKSCLNSRPLIPLQCDEDGIEALTPGHFLIGKPPESIPDPAFSSCTLSLLRCWHLCQALVCHFWQIWSTEYISSLRHYTKWHHPTRNVQVGDVVILQEDNMVPTKWPLAKVIQTHTGKDGLVRVVTIKTATGTYKRPVTKIALLLPSDSPPKLLDCTYLCSFVWLMLNHCTCSFSLIAICNEVNFPSTCDAHYTSNYYPRESSTGTEAQNKLFKCSFLPRKKQNATLSSAINIIVENYLPSVKHKYLLQNHQQSSIFHTSFIAKRLSARHLILQYNLAACCMSVTHWNAIIAGDFSYIIDIPSATYVLIYTVNVHVLSSHAQYCHNTSKQLARLRKRRQREWPRHTL